VASPADPSSASDDASAEQHAPRARATAVRTLARGVRLVATALAIVLALALGIPWLVNLVW